MASDSDRPLVAAIRAAAVARLGSRLLLLKIVAPIVALVAVGFALIVLLLGIVAPPSNAGSCGGTGDKLELDARGIPKHLIPLYERAAERYHLGPRGPSILAAINKVETAFGRLDAPGVKSGQNFAGAKGPMQFLQGTWDAYGVDGNKDGRKNVYDPEDAIPGAANYLKASGAPGSWYRAIWAYNHADWYVAKVLGFAKKFGDAKTDRDDTAADQGAAPAGGACDTGTETEVNGVKKVCGGGRFVAAPGFPGERIDRRLLPDLRFLVREYKIHLTDGYALTGHSSAGEHPIGIAMDIGPGKGGSWNDIDRLARWAEPRPNAPKPPFRWVGYDGDANHGRGHHLHLSWNHEGRRANGTPPRCVFVLDLER